MFVWLVVGGGSADFIEAAAEARVVIGDKKRESKKERWRRNDADADDDDDFNDFNSTSCWHSWLLVTF